MVTASMPLRATTIRFDDTAAQIIQGVAEDAGVSFSQFVREAALIRAVMRLMAAEHTPETETLAPADVARLIHACSERVVELARVTDRES